MEAVLSAAIAEETSAAGVRVAAEYWCSVFGLLFPADWIAATDFSACGCWAAGGLVGATPTDGLLPALKVALPADKDHHCRLHHKLEPVHLWHRNKTLSRHRRVLTQALRVSCW